MSENKSDQAGGICACIFAVLIGGGIFLPSPYSAWSHYLVGFWLAAWVGFGTSINSKLSPMELFKNAIVGCVVVAGIVGSCYGDASYDEGDLRFDEGFPTTFDSKSGQAVRVFGKLLFGAFAGVGLAAMINRSHRPNGNPQ